MQPMLLLRVEHALVPARDTTVVSAMAEIMTRPCFAPLTRVALDTRQGRSMRHTRTSPEAIRTFLCDPRCDAVIIDSGRRGELTADACLPTGLVIEPDYWDAYPAPLEPHVIVPHEPALAAGRIDAFCELATAVQVVAGCVSMELGLRLAQHLAYGGSSQPPDAVEVQPGMSLRRLAERGRYDKRKLDREVPSPEWGLFLSRKHLDVVPASALEASGVFHQVRRLGDDLVFLQLTEDPADALRPEYDDLLDPVRRVLAPVLSPPWE